MKKLVSLLTGAFLLFAPVANATVVITGDPGGVIESFVQRYEVIRASGDHGSSPALATPLAP
jgi:hypothetical protein